MPLQIRRNTRDWEAVFGSWAQPPGKTEQEKGDRAVRAIVNAVGKSRALAARNVSTFIQGSHRNRTSVRQDSDVDVCVLCSDTIIFDYPPGVSHLATGLSPAIYHFADYKNDLHRALSEHFGAANVTRGSKAFDIHENTYRVDADAAPCFEFRQYFLDNYGQLRFVQGTAMFADRDGRRISNFPQQQYDNGVAKNTSTGRRFKKMVRILKKLCNEMRDAGIASAGPVPSFLLESAVWNVPDILFHQGDSYREQFDSITSYVYGQTQADEGCRGWTEENGIKLLFCPAQEWTRHQLNAFAFAAWNYVHST